MTYSDDPWFHIIYDEETYLKARQELAQDERYNKHIRAIFTHSGYNRQPAQVYYNIVADLVRKHIPLHVDFSIQSESLLAEIQAGKEKLNKFDKRDLLTEGYTLMFQKNIKS